MQSDERAAGFLVSPEGEACLRHIAPITADPLRQYTEAQRWLRAQTTVADTEIDAVAGLAVDVSEAREKAKGRFPKAEQLFFTKEALAQATSPAVAAYHGEHLKRHFRSVTDLGCGVGMDSIAFARASLEVVAIERDPVRLLFAQRNAEVSGVAERIRFVQADANEWDITTESVFADPARRTDTGVRISRHADLYAPPLAVVIEKVRGVRGGCLKLSPLLPDEILRECGGDVIFLSEKRECKEACVWLGEAQSRPTVGAIGAHVIGSEETIWAQGETFGTRSVGAFVYEPDPAVIRAGVLPNVANRWGIGAISPDDVYLTSDALLPTPWVRCYRVVEAMPFHRKEVAAFVRKAGYGRVVVKKRRARMEPEAVLAEIKASNRGPEPEIVLILVREAKGHSVVFCTPETTIPSED